MNKAAGVCNTNLLQFVGTCLDEEMIILLKLLTTSLHKYLEDFAPARPSARLRTFVSMLPKLSTYLHLMQPHPIVQDISSANVLLELLPGDKWRATVTDYGSVNLQSQLQTRNPV